MDSLSQAVLGAAVTVAVMQGRTAVWKAAALGAVAGTLPDLDVLLDHGDAVLNMVLHRAESHAFFWLALFSLPFSWLCAHALREGAQWRRWWLALGLALLTHPVLDAFTIYGTQLLLPFTNEPYGLGNLFIVDPAYTLPLLLGVLVACVWGRRPWGLRMNTIGLALSTAYIGWSVGAQAHVAGLARESLTAQGLPADRVLVTPTPLNTVLWRVVAVDDAGSAYREGFYSLLDAPTAARDRITFERFERGNALAKELAGVDAAQRIQAFTHGFWAVSEQGQRLTITDLRMGQVPNYVFAFDVAERRDGAVVALRPTVEAGGRGDPSAGLDWLWRRMGGERLPSPR